MERIGEPSSLSLLFNREKARCTHTHSHTKYTIIQHISTHVSSHSILQEDEEWWECKQRPRQSSIFLGCQLDVFAARRRLCKDDNFIAQTLKGITSQRSCRWSALKPSVRNTLTHVPPSDLCQFTRSKWIVYLGSVSDWMCVYCYPQNDSTWEDLIGSVSVYMNGAGCRQKGCVPTLTQDTAEDQFRPALWPCCSNTKPPLCSISFCQSDPVSHHPTATLAHPDQKSWRLPVQSEERESINPYRFSSSFCMALSQNSTPYWHLWSISRVRAYCQSDLHSAPYPILI